MRILFLSVIYLFVGEKQGRAWEDVEVQCPTLIWISARGLRLKYFNSEDYAGIHALSGKLSKILTLIPAFVTEHVVNEFTQATGYLPHNHKIYSGQMYNQKNLELFTESSKENHWWNWNGRITPIWTINDNHDDKRVSYVTGWAGFEGSNSGKLLNHPVVSSKAIKARLDAASRVIDALKAKKFNLIMATFNFMSGHVSALNTVKKTVIDNSITNIVQELENAGCLETTNLIITSDHGYRKTDSKDSFKLYDLVTEKPSLILSGGVTQFIVPPASTTTEEYLKMLQDLQSDTFVASHTKDVFPGSENDDPQRLPPICVIPKPGIYFTDKKMGDKNKDGYNPLESPDMRGFLVALGPNIKYLITNQPFDSVDVFPLVCKILGLEKECTGTDAKNNLAEQLYQKMEPLKSVTLVAIIIPIASILILGFVAIVIVKKRSTMKMEESAD